MNNSLLQDESGILHIAEDSIQADDLPFALRGYLRIKPTGNNQINTFLPIFIDQQEPGVYGFPLTVLYELEGEPATAKTGCSYYAGGTFGCMTTAVQYTHLFDFIGTIGFRCVSEPIRD